jgi:YHS domain-containing protein
MPSCLAPTDPRRLHERYARELVLVARQGGPNERDLFLRRYDAYLGGLAVWLSSLTPEEHEPVFEDALRCQSGCWPQSVLGMRLAFPRWFRSRVDDLWAAWASLAGFRPQGLAIDPVCLMLLDPGAAPYSTGAGANTVYFCCPHCLAAYEGPTPASALAARASANTAG